MRIYNLQKFKDRRKELRENSTPEEQLLWERLKTKKLGVKFRRQHSIGPYIADFYCPEKKLVIELDGNQHRDAREYDEERTNYFNALEITVLRFWNEEVKKSIEGVIKKIQENIK